MNRQETSNLYQNSEHSQSKSRVSSSSNNTLKNVHYEEPSCKSLFETDNQQQANYRSDFSSNQEQSILHNRQSFKMSTQNKG